MVFLSRATTTLQVFHRLRLIESYGTGIRKIYALYKNRPQQPRIEVTHNTFKLILPNMNAAVEENTKKKQQSRQRILRRR